MLVRLYKVSQLYVYIGLPLLGLPISLLCLTSRSPLSPHLPPGGHCRAGALWAIQSLPLAAHFTHGVVYASVLFSQFIPLSPHPHDYDSHNEISSFKALAFKSK